MIEVFKMLNGFDRVNIDNLLILDTQSRTWEHKLKLKENRFKTGIGNYWFTNRIIDQWNTLPASIMESNSINAFKNRLDKYFSNLGILWVRDTLNCLSHCILLTQAPSKWINWSHVVWYSMIWLTVLNLNYIRENIYFFKLNIWFWCPICPKYISSPDYALG